MYVEEFILKVGKDTNHIKAGKAIATNVMAYRKVYIDVIGASANYIATKAFIEATTILVVSGCSIYPFCHHTKFQRQAIVKLKPL